MRTITLVHRSPRPMPRFIEGELEALETHPGLSRPCLGPRSIKIRPKTLILVPMRRMPSLVKSRSGSNH